MMDICILDFETYWDATHSLSKMNPIQYVMHPKTEIISMAVKFIRTGAVGETQVIFGEDNIKNFCAGIDWSNTMVVAHNGEGFDFLIAAWRLGIKPKMWVCTMAMARPRYSKTLATFIDPHSGKEVSKDGVSLAKLAAEFGLEAKGSLEATNTKGKHLVNFTPQEVEAMREYNKRDVDLCWEIFRRLIKETPKDELRLMDMTVRMMVEPQFEVDTELLTRTLREERERKQLMLLDLATMIGVYKPDISDDEIAESVMKTLGSAAKFSKLLKDLGVEVPTKISPTTGKPVPALAKTDEAFIALQNHSDPIVAAAAAARLGIKSTLLETRIEAFLEAAAAAQGRLPIPTKYYGADTTGRRSGWGYNPLNLPRVARDKDGNIVDKPTNALRMCIRAPKGHKIVVADLSGIELRVNHFLWQVPSSMALFRADPEKADLYKEFAASLYDKPKDAVTKDERQIGKLAHLGLQYGAGAKTFKKIAKIMGGADLDEDECAIIVAKWREDYNQIVQGWYSCNDALHVIMQECTGYPVDPWGLITPVPGGLMLPSERMICYPGLRVEQEDGGKASIVYGYDRNKAFIRGPKVVENIVQALSRDIIVYDALSVLKNTGYRPALELYDELVYVAPDAEAEDLLAEVLRVMRTPPKWWPELVTWSEGDIADTYGAAK